MQKDVNKIALLSQINSGNHTSRLENENLILDLRIQFILISKLTIFQTLLFKAKLIQFSNKQFPEINSFIHLANKHCEGSGAWRGHKKGCNPNKWFAVS